MRKISAVPKADKEENPATANVWSTADFAFARRELSDEFPQHTAAAVASALHAAEKKLPATSGRVRLVQLARELIRAQ